LKKCNECGGEVSSSAKVCPHCGKKLKASGCDLIIFILLAAILLPFLIHAVFKAMDSSNKGGYKPANIPELVEYKVVKRWEIQGRGWGKLVLISPDKRNLDDMLKLGKTLEYDSRNHNFAVISVYDDIKAIESRDAVLNERADKKTTDFYDKHMVGVYNQNGGKKMWTIYLEGVSKQITEQVNY